MRLAKLWLLGLAALLFPAFASAAPLDKGTSILAIQLTRGVADLTGDAGGILISFQRPESGVQAQYWYFMAKEYGLNADVGIGYFKESDTADPAVIGATDFTQTVSSWHFRLGGDRFAQVTPKLQVFAGPGIQIWSGKAKAKDPSGEVEGPSTTRWSLTGRVGAHIVISQNFGLIGHVGQYWGYASASEEGAKTKWLPSGTEGSMGFSFGF